MLIFIFGLLKKNVNFIFKNSNQLALISDIKYTNFIRAFLAKLKLHFVCTSEFSSVGMDNA